jgi:O-antigen/teichoic acid export membrane protein
VDAGPAASQARSSAGGASRLGQLAGQSFVYGLGGLVSRAVGIVLVPLYLHHVTRAQFGSVELVMASITLAAGVFKLNVTNAMFRFSFDNPGTDTRQRTVQSAFSCMLVTSTFAVLLGLVFIDPLAQVLGGRAITLIGLTGLWVTMNFEIITGVYRIEQRAQAYAAYSVANTLITIALTIVLVIPLHLQASGIMIGNFSGTYLTYLAMLYARRQTVGFRYVDRSLLRRMLHFSVPLMPAVLALWALNVADRFQVQYLASRAAVGSYSAASKVALAVLLPIAAFQTAWPAFANSLPSERETKATYRLVLSYWSMAMGWIVVAISALTPPYVHLAFPRPVWDAAPVVPLLMFGSVLYGVFMILNAGVNRSMKTRLTPVVTGVAAVVNVGLNFIVIPAWGIVGAGISTVVGFVVLVVLAWLNSQHSYPVAYQWSRVLRVTAVAVVLVAITTVVLPATGAPVLAARIGLIAVYPLGLMAVRAIGPGERRRVAELISTLRKDRARARAADVDEAAEEEPVEPVA